MTVIQEAVDTIGGADTNTMFAFAAPVVRDASDGPAMVTTVAVRCTPIGGVLTTPDLDPGPATVMVGTKSYAIEVPDSPSPVRLWPLIEAGLPIPAAEEASAVRNGGGARRIEIDELADYLAIPTPDPETLYFVPE